MPYEIHWQKRYEFVYAGMKIKPCKRNNRQNSDHTKMQSEHGQKLSKLSSEERPDAGCGIKR